MPAKPVPIPDALTEGFWEAADAGQLAIQRCDRCGHLSQPPVPFCRACLAPEPAFSFVPVSGRGTLRTWTVARTAFLPAFEPDLPWVVADVELEEQPGLRLVAPLLGADAGTLTAGLAVHVTFDERPEGPAVPCFRLTGPAT